MNTPLPSTTEFNLQRQTLLIVDDNPTNLGVIVSSFKNYGFEILVARSGETALKSVQHARPDLILLDVMMPGIDGFETCRRLKANPATQDIPIIFMTALAETEDKVKGFEAGAVDYVTKPLHQEEVLARVTTHLKIQHLTQNLQERNLRLQQLTDELQQANKTLAKLNADKDKFFSIISHDLRDPFTNILGHAQLMIALPDRSSKEDFVEMAQSIYRGAKATHDLLENLLFWSRIQRGNIEYHPDQLQLWPLAQKTVELLDEIAVTKNIHLINTIPPTLTVYADQNMISTIIRNLTNNALKFTPNGGAVTLSARREQASENGASLSTDFVVVSVSDTGIGIEPEDIDKLFRIDVHHTTAGTNKERGTGLGLIICKEMVEQNGGRIWVKSQVGRGTKVEFIIPASQ